MPITVLILTAVAVSVHAGRIAPLNAGPHGFSEILYAFTSVTNNNGSAFAGLSVNTAFYNVIETIGLLLGRFAIMVPVLALAGRWRPSEPCPLGGHVPHRPADVHRPADRRHPDRRRADLLPRPVARPARRAAVAREVLLMSANDLHVPRPDAPRRRIGSAIAAQARGWGTDAIVLSRRRRTAIGVLLLGSVTNQPEDLHPLPGRAATARRIPVPCVGRRFAHMHVVDHVPGVTTAAAQAGGPPSPGGHRAGRGLFDREILAHACLDAFRKLDPRVQVKNPVMFVVLIGTVVTFVESIAHPGIFAWSVTAWLALTVLFANFAEAVAEGRGKAQADTLRKMRSDTQRAGCCADGTEERVAAAELAKGDVVVCEAGDVIPSDGEII